MQDCAKIIKKDYKLFMGLSLEAKDSKWLHTK